MTQKVSVPANREDERGSKRRLRSIKGKRLKRSPNSGRPGAPIAAPAGQRPRQRRS